MITATTPSLTSTVTAATTVKTLQKTAGREYTAASVADDQTDAQKLGLVKQKDGNYAAASANGVTSTGTAATTSSSAVQAALTSLTLAG
ncbi:hypothetical protein [Lichenifustis flavocetrariae]|uniref:Uncharacterized protein n=1 Tax=Lichenifustis flavocetrariae TaxID=2949735 RepID=A0AA42CM57_9HYPH|nr:hypothetical protein [Lichenifustis flavocetrariae]MCW6512334.1 hypothetical protein [Lichenifustis flavocetrariae]